MLGELFEPDAVQDEDQKASEEHVIWLLLLSQQTFDSIDELSFVGVLGSQFFEDIDVLVFADLIQFRLDQFLGFSTFSWWHQLIKCEVLVIKYSRMIIWRVK